MNLNYTNLLCYKSKYKTLNTLKKSENIRIYNVHMYSIASYFYIFLIYESTYFILE